MRSISSNFLQKVIAYGHHGSCYNVPHILVCDTVLAVSHTVLAMLIAIITVINANYVYND